MININYFFSQFIVSLMIILSVAFYTLLERKILSYSQNRKGPNKISLMGLIQPTSDAMKLLTKKEMKLTFSNNYFYWTPPFYSFFMFMIVINLIPMKTNMSEIKLSWMIFFCVIALLSFSSIFMGWSSNSKYTMLGSLRALAQSISYEVILIMSIFVFLLMTNTFSLINLYKEKLLMIFILKIIYILFITSLICEVNRAPFDLAEGESELVSGFNTEYGMTKFSLIFLTEYGMMIFMSLIMSSIFNNLILMGMLLKIIFFMMLFLFLRASYPRMRYDLLMYLTWKNILSVLMLISIFVVMIL